MGIPALRTEGLSKHYGDVVALDHLDLEVRRGRWSATSARTAPARPPPSGCCWASIRPTGGRGEIFGLDCQRRSVEAHRPWPSWPARSNLWPSLTGAETLHLLGRVQGRVDEHYRDELIARFDLDPSKKIRAYSKGNRQKVVLIAALMTRPDLLVLDEPTSGLDPLMEQAFRASIGEAPPAWPDRLPLVPHHERGRGALRPGGHPPRRAPRRDGDPGRDAPPVGPGTSRPPSRAPSPTSAASPVSAPWRSTAGPCAARCGDRSGPLLKVLAGAGVTELLSREPSLEELFLALYGADRAG